jgi:hypothetical protein
MPPPGLRGDHSHVNQTESRRERQAAQPDAMFRAANEEEEHEWFEGSGFSSA